MAVERADENLTLRLAGSLKRRLIEAAVSQNLKLSPFVLKTLQEAVEPGGGAPATGVEQLRDVVEQAGIPWPEFRGDVLRQLTPPTYSPWLGAPGRQVVSERESLDLHGHCVQQFLAGLGEGGAPPPVAVVVPRAAALEPASPAFNHYLARLVPALRPALAAPRVVTRLLFIDRRPGAEFGAADEQLFAALLGEGPDRPGRAGRLQVGYLSLADALTGPGTLDREYLNLFAVYGAEAVGFTVESRCGIPVRFAFSRAALDVGYWGRRLEELWNLCPAGETRVRMNPESPLSPSPRAPGGPSP